MDILMSFFSSGNIYYYIIIGVLAVVAILSTTIILLDHQNHKKYNRARRDIPEALEEEEDIKPSALENVMKQMESDLENKEKTSITTFEQEQEEKAIISYQELLKYANRTKDNNEEKSENSELTDVVSKITSPKYEQVSLDLTNEKEADKPILDEQITVEDKTSIDDKSQFKNTEFISPIYGKMNANIKYPTVGEVKKEDIIESLKHNTSLSAEDIDDEIKRSTEFLNALKEFRNNLE